MDRAGRQSRSTGRAVCLLNTPIWMDTRAADICDELNEEDRGGRRIFELCGNSLQPSYTTAKIIWYQRNLPESLCARLIRSCSPTAILPRSCTGVMTQDSFPGIWAAPLSTCSTGTWDIKRCVRGLGILGGAIAGNPCLP